MPRGPSLHCGSFSAPPSRCHRCPELRRDRDRDPTGGRIRCRDAVPRAAGVEDDVVPRGRRARQEEDEQADANEARRVRVQAMQRLVRGAREVRHVDGEVGLDARLTGTLCKHRRAHAHRAFQVDSRACPALLLELTVPMASLVCEMSFALISITLGCDGAKAACVFPIAAMVGTTNGGGDRKPVGVERRMQEDDERMEMSIATDRRVPRVIREVGAKRLGLLLELWVNFGAQKVERVPT
ncbi:hypothetical protein C2845_PM03G29330 [Panicum miliaceum]|uniref:Uncharacterized protein n=1 Tax=Panicum miliaceum TaxID=4540 RepID=A0A3L6T535_PANMI|nr:hypothetical protein C2845_PM03G29330 [Panicum miliaceum]